MIYLSYPFSQAWLGKDPFEEVKKIQGKICRKIDDRKTLNFKFNEESFYIKIHHGTSLREVIKNIICLKLPVFGAKNEFEAIKRLHELGVGTMDVVAFAEKGINPLRKESFIITRDLSPAISLEDFCQTWKINPPTYSLKKKLIEKVAIMVRRMHEGGVNHRDCYLCHFLMQPQCNADADPELHIIDLHRAQIRKKVPARWIEKDLSELYFSTFEIGLGASDYIRFLRVYYNVKSIKNLFKNGEKFFNILQRKARSIEERTRRRKL